MNEVYAEYARPGGWNGQYDCSRYKIVFPNT